MYHFIVPLNVVGMLVPLPMNAVTYGETATLIVCISASTRRSSAVALNTLGLGVRFMLTTMWILMLGAYTVGASSLGASP